MLRPLGNKPTHDDDKHHVMWLVGTGSGGGSRRVERDVTPTWAVCVLCWFLLLLGIP